MLFLKKRRRKKRSQKTTVANGNDSMGPSHKEMGTKKPRCALLKAFRIFFFFKMLHRSHPAEHSVWAQIHSPQGNRLGKNSESPRMKLRRHCQQLGLCLFPPCHSIFLEPCQVLGVLVFFVVFTLAFTTGQTSSSLRSTKEAPRSQSKQTSAFTPFFPSAVRLCNRLNPFTAPACLLLGVLFYFPNLSVFVSSYVKTKKFVSFQFNSLAISWPPWVRVWGWASYRFSLLALLFLGLQRSFTMYE